LLTGMTGNSLHMQWPLTSQLPGSVSQREQLFFVTNQTTRLAFTVFLDIYGFYPRYLKINVTRMIKNPNGHKHIF
jgi:hypothetical protein